MSLVNIDLKARWNDESSKAFLKLITEPKLTLLRAVVGNDHCLSDTVGLQTPLGRSYIPISF